MESVPNKVETLVGAKMPSLFNNYLTLYAISRNQLKSKIIRRIFDEWFETASYMYTDESLIEDIAIKKRIAWKEQKSIIPKHEHSDYYYKFLETVRKDLTQKGLCPDYIAQIMERINI